MYVCRVLDFHLIISANTPETCQTDKSRFIVDRKLFDTYRNGYESQLDDLDSKEQTNDDGRNPIGEIANVVHRATMKAFKEFQRVMERYRAKDFGKNSSRSISTCGRFSV